MTDETTPQDGKAMSPASLGSVAGEPVAWAVVCGDYVDSTFTDRDKAVEWAGRLIPPAHIVALYRSPTLTDAEREAVETAMNAYGSDNADPECAAIEATLWGLLERTK